MKKCDICLSKTVRETTIVVSKTELHLCSKCAQTFIDLRVYTDELVRVGHLPPMENVDSTVLDYMLHYTSDGE